MTKYLLIALMALSTVSGAQIYCGSAGALYAPLTTTYGTWSLIGSVGANGNTTSAICTLNCSGAKLILVSIGFYGFSYGVGTLSDGHNSYTQVTNYYGSASYAMYSQVFYCLNPTYTSSALVLTYSASLTYPSITAAAWSATYTPYVDIVNSGVNISYVASIQPGSVTTSYPNELCVTANATLNNGSGTVSPNTGWTLVSAPFNPGTAEGSYLSYHQQTSAGAINPTTTSTTANLAGDQILTFYNH